MESDDDQFQLDFVTDGALMNTSTIEDVIVPPPSTINRLIILAVIMLVALIGNCIIIVIVNDNYRYRGHQTSNRVSIFILNLAISDLAVSLITIPGEMIFILFGEWVLGKTACKVITFGQIVALAGTIFNLSAMSYDRYLAICQPLRFSSARSARRTIAVAWILAFLLSIPQLFIFVHVQRGTHSTDGTPIYDCASLGYTARWQRRVYFSCLTICILVIPAGLITFCYVSIVRVVWNQGTTLRKSDDKLLSRAKVRTIKLTLCIIMTFLTCWAPYFIVNNIRIHYQAPIPTSIRAFAETFALVNSAINPIIYMSFNFNFNCCCLRPFRFHRNRLNNVDTNAGGIGSVGGSMIRNAVVNFNTTTELSSSTCVEDMTIVQVTTSSVSPANSDKLNRSVKPESSTGHRRNSINLIKLQKLQQRQNI